MLTIGSLFSGIGGLELGLEWSGLGHTVWQVEQDAGCRAVLAHHWPHAERFEDVRTVGSAQLVRVDLVCGGFPCQDVSSAGKRVGLAGARSGLWHEFARIVGELRPRWVVVENVTSGASKWVDSVRGSLERLGYASLPVPLAASDCGAPHERARVFIVACRHADADDQVVAPTDDGQRRAGEPSGDAADPDRNIVRIESRRGCGPRRRGAAESAQHGGWTTEPDVARVVHGLPGRPHRERMLGNSVVPQCAEVVGHVIRKLLEAGSGLTSGEKARQAK